MYFMMEYDVPKVGGREDAYWKLVKEKLAPLKEKMMELDCVERDTYFGDNTGHMVRLLEFENTEAFSMLWNEPEFQRVMSGFALVVDNLSYRLGRPGIMKLNLFSYKSL